MTECNLGQGTEPKVTPGSQGAQPQRSLHFLCSWLRIPSFPSTPGQGRSLCPRSPSAQDQKFPLPSTSSPFLPGSHCSEPFYSLRFSLFFQNLHSKAALHIPALISKLFFFKKKQTQVLEDGSSVSSTLWVQSGGEGGKAGWVCEPDAATFAMAKFRFFLKIRILIQNSQFFQKSRASLCPGAPLSVPGCRGCCSFLSQAHLVQVNSLTLFQLTL